MLRRRRGPPILGSGAGGAGGPYDANAVSFDGAADWLSRGADLNGVADGGAFTFSAWVNMQGGDGTNQNILINNSGRFLVRRASNNTFRIAGNNAAGTVILAKNSTSTLVAAGSWVHLLIAGDLALGASSFRIYLNDVNDTAAAGTFTNDALDYTDTDWSIGATPAGGAKLTADVADLWFAPSYLDISVEANRRKFIDDSGKPVNLGSIGQFPTGSAPLVFLSGATDNWHTNKDTGGGFTENGELTDAASSPSD